MKLSEKMSYLKGLAAGLEIDVTTKEGRILSEMMEVLETAVMYIDDLQDQVDELTELCEDLDEDLGEVEEFLLDEDEDFDGEDDDEDYDFDEDEDLYETVCPTCENTIVLADSILDEGSMKCPCCGELLEFDFDDISIEDFEESDQEDEE
ncbi:MAG: CD1247 N-terminal domain-containing protein [Ruminococcus sp.]